MLFGLAALAAAPAAPAQGGRLAFIDGLRSHGYVLGKNIEIIYASAQNAAEFMLEVCQDLLVQKVDVIVASGGVAVMAAKKCTTTVPVVIQALGDPVGVGAVRSLSRPEANITGVSFLSSDLAGKRVELMPAAKRVAVLWDTRNLNARAESAATIAALNRTGMQAERHGLDSDAALRRFLAEVKANRPDALYVVFEAGLVGTNRTAIAQAALEHPHRGGRADELCAGHPGDVPALGVQRGPHPQGCQAGRAADRDAAVGRARGQPQNREGARHRRSTVVPRAC